MSGSALVLHDDESTLTLVRGLVESAGLEPVGVSSVYSLMLGGGPPSPRLVILGMTAIDGRDVEIVAVLRARWPAATLLVLYPASLRERAARALAMGADACLPEPFYAAELSAIARRAAQPVPSAVPVAPVAPPASGVAELAAAVAHSIRNPLQIIELHLGAGESNGGVDFAAVRSQLQRIADVVEDLTQRSGQGGLAARSFDLGRLVEQVFGQPAPAGPGPTVVIHPGSEAATVVASQDLLHAAFETLRARALRVTPAGGRVEVTTRVVDRTVEIAVSDGGPALPDAERARLLDPRAGSELAGPAAVVQDHGGTIEATPADGAGTSIVIRFPTTGGK